MQGERPGIPSVCDKSARPDPSAIIALHTTTTTTTVGITLIVRFDAISQHQWPPQHREGASPEQHTSAAPMWPT
jgi:hypothetical protein